jgi:hypothetical protein
MQAAIPPGKEPIMGGDDRMANTGDALKGKA